MKRKILIVPPAVFPCNNLGDQAMLISAVQKIGSLHDVEILTLEQGVLNLFGNVSVKTLCSRSLFQYADKIHLPLRMLANFKTLFELRGKFAKIVEEFDEVVCLGADVIDGKYGYWFGLDVIKIADSQGKKVRVVSFSVSVNPDPEFVRAVSGLTENVRFFLRDYYSFNRFCELFPDKNASLASDLAYDLDFARQPGHEVKTLAIALAKRGAYDIESVKNEIRKIVEKHFEGWRILVVSHLLYKKDRELCEEFCSELEVEHKDFCAERNVVDLWSELSRASVMISCLMHPVIGSFSSAIPSVALEYQDKMAGQFRGFGLESLLAHALTDLEGVASRLKSERAELKDQIEAKLPAIKKLARSNLTGLI